MRYELIPTVGTRPSRSVLLSLLLLAFAVPVLIAAVVPLGDYGGHLARYYIQLNLPHSPSLQRWYAFDWALNGNLGADILIELLGPLAGVELAGRLIVAAIPPLFVAGIFAVSKAVHGRVTPLAIAATPLAFAAPFQFGFVNFWLSIALALLAFALWVRLDGSRAWAFAVVAPVVFVCHLYGWAVLAVLVASWQLAEAWRRRSLRPLVPVLTLAVPLPLMLMGQSGAGSPWAADFFNWQAKLVFALQPLRDQWFWLDVPSVALLYALAGLGLWSSDFRRNAGLVVAAGLLAAFYLLLPRILLGSILADMRLVSVVLVVALLATAPVRDSRLLMAGAVAFALVRLAAATASFLINGQALANELRALDHVPRGAALVTLFGNGSAGNGWQMSRAGHLPSYAIVRREAFASDQFIYPGANSLRLVAAPVPQIAKDMEHHAFTADEMQRKLRLVSPGKVDALWIIQDPRGAPPTPAGFRPVWRSGSSAVFVPFSRG